MKIDVKTQDSALWLMGVVFFCLWAPVYEFILKDRDIPMIGSFFVIAIGYVSYLAYKATTYYKVKNYISNPSERKLRALEEDDITELDIEDVRHSLIVEKNQKEENQKQEMSAASEPRRTTRTRSSNKSDALSDIASAAAPLLAAKVAYELTNTKRESEYTFSHKEMGKWQGSGYAGSKEEKK